MTVKELKEKLNEFDDDMLIGVDYNPFDDIEISIREWVDSSPPYNRPSFNYIDLE